MPSCARACRTLSPAKQRFDVYVCTAANREYALEAWRLLDPRGVLIPAHKRTERINSGSREKSLADVMGLGHLPPPPPRTRPGTLPPLRVPRMQTRK